MNSLEILDVFNKSDELPVMNSEITKVINMISDSENIDIGEFSDKIANCGNLSEVLLRNVNSGYFKLQRKIDSLEEAIVYLGMRTVEKLAIAYLIKSLIPVEIGKSKELNRDKYWKHCLATSIAANLLAEKLGKVDKYKYFAYGLIHDIGIVILDICLPNLIDEVVNMQKKGIHQIVAERLVMKGFTHEQSGRWQCEKWGLPEDIKAIVEHHHTPLLAEKYFEEVNIMCLADSISSFYYERLLCLNTSYVFNRSVMNKLGVTDNDIEEISRVLPIKVEEADKQLNFNLFTVLK
ncbi:HDOD domain-containing protein [Clostridium sp. CS001]|uniref:HDOD domain-containing protein n=1 Tax=Clostridium sp. CS001 TaxID=2880648 RepID=UPI001CF5ED2E|nr:HDOD domain-containing protein [Clostridium sp. CS001]MCB2289790.1 HDOD domain-containing protein [Clostridium sp. CS001]